MGIEIERRFLVRANALPGKLPTGARLLQGYLSFAPLVRVRTVTPLRRHVTRAFLTVKGRGTRVRAEFEYPIPARDAKALLALCGAMTIQKVRHCIGPWELDCYEGRHVGLWLAEIELSRPDQSLPDPLPVWIGREVTDDPRYTNSRLARLERWPPSWARKR
jgi:adenylate cyclase